MAMQNGGSAPSYQEHSLNWRTERRPAPEDLHVLAISTWPRFAALVHGDEPLVEDILRSVFKQLPVRDEITGAKLVVLGSVTLAVLLDDPSKDLDVIRPHLANSPCCPHNSCIVWHIPSRLGCRSDRPCHLVIARAEPIVLGLAEHLVRRSV